MDNRHQARFRRASFNSLVLSALFVGCLSLLFTSADLARKERAHVDSTNGSTNRIDLSSDWSFAPEAISRAPGDMPRAPSEGWTAFSPQSSWRYPDLHGGQWFKTSFWATYGYESPALVLGRISGIHRVYLNGHLIGGSDVAEPLAFYSFAPELLKLDAPNELLVSVRSPRSLTPGITEMPGVGMFLGNAADVRQKAMNGETRFYVSRSITLALSIALFLASLSFAIFFRAHRHYFYGSLFLLLCALNLSPLHPFVAMKLDFTHLRLLQTVGLAVVPFVMASAYLHLRRRYLAEAWNNGITLLNLAAGTAWMISQGESQASDFLQNALKFSLIYGGIWVSGAWLETVIQFKVEGEKRLSQSPVFQILFLTFASVALFTSYHALHESTSAWSHAWTERWALSSGFVFFFLALVASTLERAIQGRAKTRIASRDQLVAGLIRMIHDSPDVTQAVVEIQNRVSSFLKARRSTLYLMDQVNLKATYIHGNSKVRNIIKRSVRADKGIIGYVCEHRSPLLIQDIRKDSRFASLLAERAQDPAGDTYESGSCMIFPLIVRSEILGVLTFADKANGQIFTEQDFAIALEMSHDLAILLDSRQVQESLRKKG